MIAKRLVSLIFALGLIAAAAPSTAVIFTVTLKNGNSFQTRYQPKVAEWDSNMLLFLTDVGNQIGVTKADVAKVTSSIETEGYGRVINTTTVDLGPAPNEAPRQEAQGATSKNGSSAVLLQYLERQQQMQQQQQHYTMGQFVDPSDTSGLPVSAVGNASGPMMLPTGVQPPR